MPLLTGALRHKLMKHGWLVRLFAMFRPSMKDIAAQLGRNKNASNAKAKKLLNWQPRNHEEAILAAAESLF